MTIQTLKNTLPSSPAFVLDEARLIKNLDVLATLRQQSGCKVLYSIKSLPFSTILAMAKPFVDGFSASSLFEARLADEILEGGGSIHLTTPGIRPDEISELSTLCSHISFNSLPQHQRFAPLAQAHTSVGLRINPKLSFVKDDRYNPCRKASKLGVDIDALWQSATIDTIQGLHIHTVFAATDFTALLKTIDKIKLYMGDKLGKLAWLNLGGGYLFNQIHDHRPFITAVKQLKNDFGLDVYIEPGKAAVDPGIDLVATVLDCFVSDGKTLAVLDTSVNHNPEVFEYQLQPALYEHDAHGQYKALLVGGTCLAGDMFGEYSFAKPLAVGDRVVFTNVGAYSLVKASRFNGQNLPDIYLSGSGRLKSLKHYAYQAYREQWLAD